MHLGMQHTISMRRASAAGVILANVHSNIATREAAHFCTHVHQGDQLTHAGAVVVPCMGMVERAVCPEGRWAVKMAKPANQTPLTYTTRTLWSFLCVGV